MAGEDLVALEQKTQEQGASEAWHSLRYGRITASRIHEAAHCHTKGVFVETVLGAKEFDGNMAMMRGKKLEGAVLKAVERKLGVKISKCGLYLRSDYPILGASPDGIDCNYVYEFKCPINMKSFSNYITSLNGEVIPAKKHLAQMQLQMFMAGRKKGYFCVARPDFEKNCEVEILKVQFNESLCQNLILIIKAMKFWEENIFPVMWESLF
jgi:hypothetical protein